jgi:hypothetical protein
MISTHKAEGDHPPGLRLHPTASSTCGRSRVPKADDSFAWVWKVGASLLAGIALQSNVSAPYKKNEPRNASPSIGAELDTAPCTSRFPNCRATTAAWITARISATTGPRREPGGACTTGRGATWDKRCSCMGSFGAADIRGAEVRTCALFKHRTTLAHNANTNTMAKITMKVVMSLLVLDEEDVVVDWRACQRWARKGTSGCGKFAHSNLNLGFVVRIDRDWAPLDGLTEWPAWRCALTKFGASIGRQRSTRARCSPWMREGLCDRCSLNERCNNLPISILIPMPVILAKPIRTELVRNI